MVLAEVFCAQKYCYQEEQERPRSTELGGAPVEDDKLAPEASKRELCDEWKERCPARAYSPALRARLNGVQQRNSNNAQCRVNGENRVRLQHIDTLEKEV